MLIALVIVALTLVNAYFSAVEIAFVSLKKFKIQQEADKGSKAAKYIIGLLQDPDQYLSAIQVGITLVSLIEGYYGGEMLAVKLEPVLLKWGIIPWLAHLMSLAVSIGGITYISIVIGELVPKTLALKRPHRIAFLLAPSFRIFTLIALPFVRILTGSTHLLLRLGGGQETENQKLTDADLKSLLGLAYRQGTLKKEELKIHENLFDFYDLTVDKLMVVRDKMVAVNGFAPRSATESILRKEGYEYFPVLDQQNKVTGILASKDFFMYPEKPVTDILQPCCFVRQTQTCPELLKAFKEKHKNFAVVTDDSEKLVGIITMHDIGQALVGI